MIVNEDMIQLFETMQKLNGDVNNLETIMRDNKNKQLQRIDEYQSESIDKRREEIKKNIKAEFSFSLSYEDNEIEIFTSTDTIYANTFYYPLNLLAPENLEETLQHHSAFIDEFQGAIFSRRPYSFAALMILVNFIFILYRIYNPNFFCLVCILSIIHIVHQIIPSKIYTAIKSVLLPGQLDKGQPNDPGRVRDIKELVEPINKILYPLLKFLQIVDKISNENRVTGLFIYGSIFFYLFIFTLFVDLFWPILILTNLALFIPYVFTRPQVIPYVQKVKDIINDKMAEEKSADEIIHEESSNDLVPEESTDDLIPEESTDDMSLEEASE